MNKINLLHYQTTMTSFMHYLTICTKLQISYVLNARVPSPTEPSMDVDRGGR